MSRFSVFIILLCIGELTPGAVVINEIHLNPDVKIEQVEFIELHNTGEQPVDLSGWKLENAVQFTFPVGSSIPARGFTVVAHQPDQFKAKFGGQALRPWIGKLHNDGASNCARRMGNWSTVSATGLVSRGRSSATRPAIRSN